MTSIRIESMGDRFAVVTEASGPGAGDPLLERVPALVAAAGHREPDGISTEGRTCRVIHLFGRGDMAAAIHWSVETTRRAAAALARAPFSAGWRLAVGMAFGGVAKVGLDHLSGAAIEDAGTGARWSRDGLPVLVDRLPARAIPTVRLARLGYAPPFTHDDEPEPYLEVSAPDHVPRPRALAVLAVHARFHKQIEFRGVITSGDFSQQRETLPDLVRFVARRSGALVLTPPSPDLALLGFEDVERALAAARCARDHADPDDRHQATILLAMTMGEVTSGVDGPTGSAVARGVAVGKAHRVGDVPVVVTGDVREHLLARAGGAAAAACPAATRQLSPSGLEVHDLDLKALDAAAPAS